MKNGKVIIAGIQQFCNQNQHQNLAQGFELLERATDRGAEVVCFPELFHTQWFPREEDEKWFMLAQNEESELIRILKQKALEKNISIIAPVFENCGEERFNSAVVIQKDGSILGKYRKNHLPDIPLYREHFYFKHGNLGFPVFEIEGFRFGIQICWDVFFPEGIRILALQNAHAVFCPTASAFQSQPRWLHMICSHAIANNIYILRINRVGDEKELEFYGDSFAVNPFGEYILEPVGKTDAVVLVEIDLSLIRTARESYAFLNNRRPEIYGPIAENDKSGRFLSVTGAANDST